jgi:NADPH-dependent glutamate synthase beta subunit-like oxidoreductase/ferredoxin
MHRITIDGRPIDCPEGTTILAAARSIGIKVPTLCHVEGFAPGTSCMVCVVKVAGLNRLVPACATAVMNGQVIETNTPEVIESRRMALELLLSDHVGDCEGPCRMACPASMDIPAMLRDVHGGRWEAAARIADALVLPETLGYICPSPCEKVCRRARHDAAVAIRPLHRETARRRRLAGAAPAPTPAAPSGRRVAVVGAGPAGLAAVRELVRLGYACTLIDRQAAAGGALRSGLDDATLPRAVLDAETQAIVSLPLVTAQWQTELRDGKHLAELAATHDAVVLAFGDNRNLAGRLGLQLTDHGIQADRHTGRTSHPRVFAAGGAVAPISRMAVRAVAAGKHVAQAIHRELDGQPEPAAKSMLNVRLGHLTPEEMALLFKGADATPRVVPAGHAPVDDAAASRESARCLHCDCRAARGCGLRTLAQEYGASLHGFDGVKRELAVDDSHAELIYESGKCISCGLCAQIAERNGELHGLTFVQRGFAVRMAPALGRELKDAIHTHADAYASICPTGALKSR